MSTDDGQILSGPSSSVSAHAGGASDLGHRDARRVQSEFERLLTEPGCPVCRYVAQTERSFFSWFEIENYGGSEVRAQLRAAMGTCAVHARRLVESPGEGHIMTVVLHEALAGARSAVRDDAQVGSCPACAAVASGSRRARAVLVDGLRDPGPARLYGEHEGVCLVHLVEALPAADHSTVKILAERMLASLCDRSGPAVFELLAGSDDDAGLRALWRERLPEAPAAGSTLQRLCHRLGIDACPVCLAAGVAGRDYLRWFLAHSAEGDESLRTDPGELCATHLHDVALADPSAAGRAAERKRAIRVGQLEFLLARLAGPPAPGRRGRRGNSDELDDARRNLVSGPYCPACHARDGVQRAEHDLVAASLGLGVVRHRYEHGHGLCVRHLKRLPKGPAARFARQHANARLAVIAWEVHETSRKYAWAYRHERSGPERDGWLRGLAQIDGRVFDGGPAPIGRHEARAGETGRSGGEGDD
jgi:hypothetical protein